MQRQAGSRREHHPRRDPDGRARLFRREARTEDPHPNLSALRPAGRVPDRLARPPGGGRLSDPHWRLLGAAGFLGLDMAALWAVCRATGHPVGALALAVAYFIGYLATMIPIPAGLGVLDSGLAGALVLYGFSPSRRSAPYSSITRSRCGFPGFGGLLAWLPTRGRVPAGDPGAGHEGAIDPAAVGGGGAQPEPVLAATR